MVKKNSNVQIVCSSLEKEKLRELATLKEVNLSDVIRECVKRIIERYAK